MCFILYCLIVLSMAQRYLISRPLNITVFNVNTTLTSNIYVNAMFMFSINQRLETYLFPFVLGGCYYYQTRTYILLSSGTSVITMYTRSQPKQMFNSIHNVVDLSCPSCCLIVTLNMIVPQSSLDIAVRGLIQMWCNLRLETP